MEVTITESAAARINALCRENGAAMVRLSVEGGGCSGFSYVFGFADEAGADDRVFTRADAKLAVDAVSLPLIAGATLDYVDALSGAHFKVDNPNAASSCGCGTSFSLG
ncbi:MAG: iron-sulfur cluster assembly accessory protein [Rhodospirillales bacterium]|nr:iron-sulfur cluster assembly accessory protein [Alphaproteobacteria bacterium]MCB9987599.1 iron-sulfur cluster assembly accessory protein [Rhodospirillales bacterium]USO07686.1 MAG: iron-sulfur cluster assembly accessory protein [Rhodospirillales bacterium]